MHPKNLHTKPYDFNALCAANTSLTSFVYKNPSGEYTIDFHNPKAVVALNTALLEHHYHITNWSIPEGYLCPPIPGRVDYLLLLADLLSNKKCTVLDIGTGANCIYPLLGSSLLGWQFVASDVDKTALVAAAENVNQNAALKTLIEVRPQHDKGFIFSGIIKDDDYFDATMCNPPFHSSQEEALKGTKRKLRNLNSKQNSPLLNFGGQANELWCNGGEALFIKRMIKESKAFASQVGIFTCLVSKKEHLPKLEKQLKKMQAFYKVVPMQQGNKQSRFLSWSFTPLEDNRE